MAIASVAISIQVINNIADRDALRAPNLNQNAGEAAIGYLLDTYSAPPLNVVLAQPAGAPDRMPPPGIPRWPTAGEAFVSTKVAESYPVGSPSPWGQVVGLISSHGLVNLNEQYVYANPAHYEIPRDSATVYSWGADAGFAGDHRSNSSAASFAYILMLTLVLPTIFLAFIACRTGRSRIGSSIRVIRGFGAGDLECSAISLARIAPEALIATTATWVIVTVAAYKPATWIPYAGVYLQGADVRDAIPKIAAGTVAGLFVVAAFAILSFRGAQIISPNFVEGTRYGNRKISIVSIISLAGLIVIPQLAMFSVEVFGIIVFALMAAFIVTTPFVVSVVMTAVGKALATFSKGATGVITGRLTLACIRISEIVAVGLIISISLSAILQLFAGFYSTMTADALHVNSQVGQRVLVLRTPQSATLDGAQIDHLLNTPNVAWLPVTDGSVDGSLGGPVEAVSDCTTLRTLGNHSCALGPSGKVPVGNEYLATSLSYLGVDLEERDDAASIAAHRFVAVSTTDQPLDLGALNRAGFSYQLRFAQVADEWTASFAMQDHQLRWLNLFVPIGTVTLLTALTVGVWERITRRIAGLAPIVAFRRGTSLLWGLSVGAVLLPFGVAVTVGAVTYVSLGVALGGMYEGLRIQPSVMGSTIALAVGYSIAVWLGLTIALHLPAQRESARHQN
ncbi:hypothetical protein JT358_11225 [Micrococcales bacterium 31B]|nr:hypothetical protein [Micrococcales bacterium 31B]